MGSTLLGQFYSFVYGGCQFLKIARHCEPPRAVHENPQTSTLLKEGAKSRDLVVSNSDSRRLRRVEAQIDVRSSKLCGVVNYILD